MNISQDKIVRGKNIGVCFGVIQLTKSVPNNMENKIIGGQLIRTATSIGANYAEANNASSKADFRSKIFIAKKEAAESRYWIQLLARANEDLDTKSLYDEVTQLLLILQKIVSTLRNDKRKIKCELVHVK